MPNNWGVFPPKLRKVLVWTRMDSKVSLGSGSAVAIRCLADRSRYRPVQLWNHIDGGRTIIASVEYPQMRALQARRAVQRFATLCIVRGAPLAGRRPPCNGSCAPPNLHYAVCRWTTLPAIGDRKSTRLNSSHRCISYAVFCL